MSFSGRKVKSDNASTCQKARSALTNLPDLTLLGLPYSRTLYQMSYYADAELESRDKLAVVIVRRE